MVVRVFYELNQRERFLRNPQFPDQTNRLVRSDATKESCHTKRGRY